MTLRTVDGVVPPGAGHPRLVLSTDGHAKVGSPEAEGIERGYLLEKSWNTIGSDDDRDIVLAGIDGEHGVVRLEADGDEYIYEQLSPGGVSQVNGAIVTRADLHHGDRLTLGGTTLVFQRDEFADHGRFDGGRQGGEASGSIAAGFGGHEDEPGTPPSS